MTSLSSYTINFIPHILCFMLVAIYIVKLSLRVITTWFLHAVLAIVWLAKIKQLVTRIKLIMATYGSLSAFISSTTNWQLYVDQLNYYFIANEITEDKNKVAVLLSACGSDTFKTICSLVDAETMKDIAYADLVKRLSEHYDPVPSSIVQRYKFHNCNRKEGESIANFVAALREICKFCDYKETLI